MTWQQPQQNSGERKMTDEIKEAKKELVKKINRFNNEIKVNESKAYDLVGTDPSTTEVKKPDHIPDVITHQKATRKRKENIPW